MKITLKNTSKTYRRRQWATFVVDAPATDAARAGGAGTDEATRQYALVGAEVPPDSLVVVGRDVPGRGRLMHALATLEPGAIVSGALEPTDAVPPPWDSTTWVTDGRHGMHAAVPWPVVHMLAPEAAAAAGQADPVVAMRAEDTRSRTVGGDPALLTWSYEASLAGGRLAWLAKVHYYARQDVVEFDWAIRNLSDQPTLLIAVGLEAREIATVLHARRLGAAALPTRVPGGPWALALTPGPTVLGPHEELRFDGFAHALPDLPAEATEPRLPTLDGLVGDEALRVSTLLAAYDGPVVVETGGWGALAAPQFVAGAVYGAWR